MLDDGCATFQGGKKFNLLKYHISELNLKATIYLRLLLFSLQHGGVLRLPRVFVAVNCVSDEASNERRGGKNLKAEMNNMDFHTHSQLVCGIPHWKKNLPINSIGIKRGK